MPPGKYVITAEPGSNKAKVFYPGTTEKKSAGVVRIGTGEHLGGFEIRLPK